MLVLAVSQGTVHHMHITLPQLHTLVQLSSGVREKTRDHLEPDYMEL